MYSISSCRPPTVKSCGSSARPARGRSVSRFIAILVALDRTTHHVSAVGEDLAVGEVWPMRVHHLVLSPHVGCHDDLVPFAADKVHRYVNLREATKSNTQSHRHTCTVTQVRNEAVRVRVAARLIRAIPQTVLLLAVVECLELAGLAQLVKVGEQPAGHALQTVHQEVVDERERIGLDGAAGDECADDEREAVGGSGVVANVLVQTRQQDADLIWDVDAGEVRRQQCLDDLEEEPHKLGSLGTNVSLVKSTSS